MELEMGKLTTEISQHQAIGILRIIYPIWAIIGMFSILYVPSKLIVPGDAVATANKIMANELLFRMGIAGSLITQLFQIAAVLVLYQLFKSVNKNQALLVVILGLVGVPIAMLNELNKFAALLLLDSADQMMFFLIYRLDILGPMAISPGLFNIQIRLLPQNLGHLDGASRFWLSPRVLHAFSPAQLRSISFSIRIMEFGEIIFMLWVVFKGAKIPQKSG
jgi:hypothetical protein